MTATIHPLFRLALAGVEPRPEPMAVLGEDLQPGDELLSTGLGGYSGTVRSVQVYPDYVRVEFVGRLVPASLARPEACSVIRRRRP